MNLLEGRRRKDETQEAAEAREAERNTVSILGSIARLEQRSVKIIVNLGQSSSNNHHSDSHIDESASRLLDFKPLNLSKSGGMGLIPPQSSQNGRDPEKIQKADLAAQKIRKADSAAQKNQISEQCKDAETNSRTVSDVFADRPPSTIDMDLLWKLQADHYREFAHRLNDEDPSVSSHADVEPIVVPRVAVNNGATHTNEQRSSKLGQASLGVSKGTTSSSAEKRGGPSRKSIRRAKRRLLETTDIHDNMLAIKCGSCNTGTEIGLLNSGQAYFALKVDLGESAQTGALEPKQAEGPEPPEVSLASAKPTTCVAEGKGQSNDGRELPLQPSKVLYVKNLDKNVSEGDLEALFLPFQKADNTPVTVRLLTKGRMKGQAFITFPDISTARDALEKLDGFRFKGRPLAVEYGRSAG